MLITIFKLLLNRFKHYFSLTVALSLVLGVSTLPALAANSAADMSGKAKAAPVILIVGDSLSAEYGLARGQGWVALLDKKLQAEKIPAKVVNASISGDTTSGGRSRLGPLLAQHKPAHVVIELGANDALRGLPMGMTADNLSAMTEAAQKAGAKVLLVGMQLPPNFGTDYGKQFANTFSKVATAKKAGLVPFFLKDVADIADPTKYFQADRIHPTAAAHPIMLGNVWPELKKQLN